MSDRGYEELATDQRRPHGLPPRSELEAASRELLTSTDVLGRGLADDMGDRLAAGGLTPVE
ncbi:hypothetical protein [Streptomyces sp. NPDC048590]|uniref:hypothetical protein n=1 Tax=Streptomyces sp. NPDC048590 TaxID=3365574 RepID=UPI00371E391B